jgi:hypothetical protein
VLCGNTFGAKTSHGQTQTHKTHHGPDLGEATTFSLIVYFAPLHEVHIQMAFLSWDSQMEVPKLPRLGLPQLWPPIPLCVDLWSGWDLKQRCHSHWELSNGMSHATCTQGNQFDFLLLMVESQTTNLTPGLSFGHNLCFKCLNESCEPILDIYFSIAFQWYKDFFNAMVFDPCDRSLKIWESIGTLTPKMGAHLGVWVFILTLSHTPGFPSWFAPLQALALVTSPRLGLR